MIPQKLCVHPRPPHYNKDALVRVDKVFVDEVLVERCYAYDISAGWAMQTNDKGIWLPKIYGVVRVTEKQ